MFKNETRGSEYAGATVGGPERVITGQARRPERRPALDTKVPRIVNESGSPSAKLDFAGPGLTEICEGLKRGEFPHGDEDVHYLFLEETTWHTHLGIADFVWKYLRPTDPLIVHLYGGGGLIGAAFNCCTLLNAISKKREVYLFVDQAYSAGTIYPLTKGITTTKHLRSIVQGHGWTGGGPDQQTGLNALAYGFKAYKDMFDSSMVMSYEHTYRARVHEALGQGLPPIDHWFSVSECVFKTFPLTKKIPKVYEDFLVDRAAIFYTREYIHYHNE